MCEQTPPDVLCRSTNLKTLNNTHTTNSISKNCSKDFQLYCKNISFKIVCTDDSLTNNDCLTALRCVYANINLLPLYIRIKTHPALLTCCMVSSFLLFFICVLTALTCPCVMRSQFISCRLRRKLGSAIIPLAPFQLMSFTPRIIATHSQTIWGVKILNVG